MDEAKNYIAMPQERKKATKFGTAKCQVNTEILTFIL